MTSEEMTERCRLRIGSLLIGLIFNYINIELASASPSSLGPAPAQIERISPEEILRLDTLEETPISALSL